MENFRIQDPDLHNKSSGSASLIFPYVRSTYFGFGSHPRTTIIIFIYSTKMPSFLQNFFYILPYYNYNVTRKNLTISIDYLYNNYTLHQCFRSVFFPWIRIRLFPESGSGSANNPDPIRKNPVPDS